MTGDDDNRQGAAEAEVRPEAAEPGPWEASWPLRHRPGMPTAIEGYVERPELEARCALPEGAAGCVDLGTQGWREVEMLGCARLRVLTALGEFEAARELAAALQAVSEKRSLVRIRMRGLALSMVLEHRAGEDGRARAHVVDYLRLFAESDYAWPLARERGVALSLLDDIAGEPGGDAAVAVASAGLRDAIRDNAEAVDDPSHWPLNGREMEVLVLLEGRSDREVAEALSLSHDGVRSRMRGIFEKLGARGRLDAVHRARAQGILPPAEEASRAEP